VPTTRTGTCPAAARCDGEHEGKLPQPSWMRDAMSCACRRWGASGRTTRQQRRQEGQRHDAALTRHRVHEVSLPRDGRRYGASSCTRLKLQAVRVGTREVPNRRVSAHEPRAVRARGPGWLLDLDSDDETPFAAERARLRPCPVGLAHSAGTAYRDPVTTCVSSGSAAVYADRSHARVEGTGPAREDAVSSHVPLSGTPARYADQLATTPQGPSSHQSNTST